MQLYKQHSDPHGGGMSSGFIFSRRWSLAILGAHVPSPSSSRTSAMPFYLCAGLSSSATKSGAERVNMTQIVKYKPEDLQASNNNIQKQCLRIFQPQSIGDHVDRNLDWSNLNFDVPGYVYVSWNQSRKYIGYNKRTTVKILTFNHLVFVTY